MRKIFKTVVATVATLAMAASLAAGYTPVDAAVVNVLAGAEWEHTHDAWEPANAPWDAALANTVVTNTATGFDADITITGWQQNWVAETPAPEDAYVLNEGQDGATWGDKPYQLTSNAFVGVVPGTTYTFKMTVTNNMTEETNKTAYHDKNVTVTINSGIPGDNDNTMLFKTYTVPKNSSLDIEETISISADYTASAIQVHIAYGSYAYSAGVTADLEAGKISQEKYDAIHELGYLLAPYTSEPVNLSGLLSFSNIELNGEEGQEVTTPPTITIPTTTNNPLIDPETTKVAPTTVAPTTVAPTTKAEVAKPAKVKVKSAKNLKGKKVKITWKKVKGAKKYQVKVGKIKKTTKKLKITIKVAKKKSYKVRVRAYNAAGYGAWSKAKKVKVSK